MGMEVQRTQQRELAARGTYMSMEAEKPLDTLTVSHQDCTGAFISQRWAMCGTAHIYQQAHWKTNNMK